MGPELAIAAALAGAAVLSPYPYTVFQARSATISDGQQVGDVLAVGGALTIRGVVRGYVYAVDADVRVARSAIVLKPMSVVRGRLRLEDGAVLPRSIVVSDAQVLGAPGNSGETAVSVIKGGVSDAKLALIKAILPFDRFSPDDGLHIEDLARWGPGLELVLERADDHPKDLVVGGVARLTLESAVERGAFQRGFRGDRGAALVSAVELEGEAHARTLWRELERIPEDKVSLSVKTELGEGAHWFFVHRRRATMLWRRGRWFFAVETRLAALGASAAEEMAFSNEVLSGLRRSLSSGVPEVAERAPFVPDGPPVRLGAGPAIYDNAAQTRGRGKR